MKGDQKKEFTKVGSQKLHSIFVFSSTDPTKLLVKFLSCFCAPCADQDWENYDITLHVPLWQTIKLQPKDLHFVCGQLEAIEELDAMEHEDDGEDLPPSVCVGTILQL
jgi:hypothetical protein